MSTSNIWQVSSLEFNNLQVLNEHNTVSRAYPVFSQSLSVAVLETDVLRPSTHDRLNPKHQ